MIFSFLFEALKPANTGGLVEYQIQNSENIFQIWEVTDPINAININNESTSGIFSFKANSGVLKEYIVLTSRRLLYTPQILFLILRITQSKCTFNTRH